MPLNTGRKIDDTALLLKNGRCFARTYRLTRDAIEALEDLTLAIRKESKIDISITKVLELIIFHSKYISA